MKGRGKRRLLTGALCLTMLFSDVGAMGMQVVASEVRQEVSALSDADNVAVNTGDNTGEEEKEVDGFCVPTDDGSQSDSVEKDTNAEDVDSTVNGEEETESGENSTEDSNVGGDDENLSDSNIIDSANNAPSNNNAENEDFQADHLEDDENNKNEGITSEEPNRAISDTTIISGVEFSYFCDYDYLDKIYYAQINSCNNYIDGNYITNVDVPEKINGYTVTTISSYAFIDCSNLISITLPSTIQFINEGSLAYGPGGLGSCTDLENIAVRLGNEKFCTESGVLYYVGYHEDDYGNIFDGDKILTCYPAGKKESTFTVPNGVVMIDNAFVNCSKLTSIILPDSLITIDAGAFYNCTNLESISIPNSVTAIGQTAFGECNSLSSVTLPNKITSIKGWTFTECSALVNITMPKSITDIEENAFNGCTCLTDVFYSGTEEEWKKISIGDGNEALISANIHYGSGTPGEGDGDSNAPGVRVSLETSPKNITYKDGYSCSKFDMNVTVMCMLPSIEAPTYDNVTAKIELSDGLSYAENAVNRSYTKNLGTMNFDAVQEQNISVPVYIDQSYITSEFQVTVSVTADGYESAQTKTFSIPVNLEKEDSILVFTTEKSLSVKTGDSMWLAFALLDSETGLYDSEWKKMSVVVSDNSVISLSDYKKTEYGYSLEVIGKKEGATNVVISDTSSGTNITIQINVYDEFVKTYSYSIDNMPSFYPDNKYEEKIETNIYNLNGLYVNNYSVQKENTTNKYKVSFDAYNSNHYYGAVDIYDKDGNWIDYEEIEKFSNMTSLWDTGEQLYYLISNSITGKLLTYEQASFSKCTPAISFEVPEDGYFIISNNVAASPGTYFANAFDILFDASATVVDLALSDSVKKTAFDDFMDENKKILMERMVDVLLDKAEQDKELQKVFLKSIESEIRKTTKKVAKIDVNSLITSSNDMYSEFVGLAEDTMNRLIVRDGDSWKQQFKMATGIGESAFAKLSGPAGIALKGCFSINKGSDKLSMAIQMALSTDNTYVKVFSSTEDCSVNQNGVIINSSGNIDTETVLQVFRISNNDTIEVVLDSDDPLERYELYNICFVKNDQLVQPNGKVIVHLPVPDGMNGDTCKVYRQEEDGSWVILDAHIEGNYLTFETEHFSLYSIVGETKNISIYSLPTNTIYNAGDILNSEGLIINVDGDLVSKGYICSPSVLSGNGIQTIMVIYGNATTEFEVTVKPANQGFHVIFNSNGGSFVEEQIVQENESVLRPDDPVREGYRFTGWYKEQSCENKWDFAVDTVQEDITLYAGWIENGAEKLYHVNFDTLNHGTAPDAYTDVKENSIISEPKAPTADGYRFTGWFKDNKCTVRWQFGTDTVTSDITLYAGWVLDDGYGDILDEDIPASGIIPAGLWIAEVSDYLYTGKAIKPEAHVYDGKTRLKKGQDYTVTYKNNTNAEDASASSKAPTIVVKGRGNYAGTETETFTIQRVSLNDSEIACDNLTAAYTSKVQKKLPSISYRGKKLSNNKDFTVSYPDLSRGITEAYCAPGIYDILLTAKDGGNYAGSRTVKFTITKNILLSKASVKKIPDQPYTGKAVEPELAVTLQNTPLIKNTDYTVTYMNNKEAGKATAVLSGIGDYAGTKKVTFYIAGTSLKKAKINKISDQTYNGLEQKPNVSLSVDGISLRNGTDYQITYANNLNVGTGTVTIKGINAYTGSIKKTFRINAYNLKEDTANRIGGLQTQIASKYLKGGSKPKVELTYAGKRLVEGVDYTLSYKNNKALTASGTGKHPVITIKGKGNFNGSITKTFTIISKALDDKELPVTLRVADMSFIDKLGNYVSKPILIDADGKKLVPGKDYSNNIIYERENGTLLDKNDELVIGDKVKVTVKGKGAYSGELQAIYEIKPEDFNKAKITVATQSYTGSDVVLDQDDITVRLNDSNLKFGTDYEIIDGSYTNNIKRGTAEVTIAGKGKYGGMKTVRFRIISKKFQWFWRLLK